MATDLRKFALRLKVIELLECYREAQRQLRIMRGWKKIWVHKN